MTTTSLLQAPLYPHRGFVKAGECGHEPIKHLEQWVRGIPFHPYGVAAHDRGPTLDEALQQIRYHPGILEFDGKLDQSGGTRGIRWGVRFQQAGDPDSWGSTRPHMTAEDAAYAALALIEEHERDLFEQASPVGHA